MKKTFLTTCIVFCVIAVMTLSAVASESTFQTSLTVGPDDTANPSIPTGLTATAVSSSQIDLSWNASTDDVAVTGYRIFRDSTAVATTTSLSYSDAGLAALTEYEYAVEAFDGTFKYSGQSATTSATTLITPVTPPTTSSGGSTGYSDLVISGLNTTPAIDSVAISFSTNYSTQAKVYWGTTSDYELGSVSGLFYDFNHMVKIDGLNPNTTYFFKIEVTNGAGRIKVLESTFQTQSIIAEPQLTNVTDFKAIPKENSIALSWNNPSSPEFDSVRLVRSDKFFPRDINDGEVVYEGADENYQDRDVSVGVTYYYSIFTKDIANTFSSGALAQARIKPAGEIAQPATSTDPFIDIPILTNVHPDIASLALTDFDFIQSSIKLVNIGTGVVIDGSKNLTISLEYRKVPEILKTIAITLIDPSDPSQVFPFLLRVNKDKTAYEATLAPLGRSGTYQMKIMVLDYKNQGLKRIEGSLKAFVFGQVKDITENQANLRRNIIALSLIALIMILVLFAVLKRREKNEAN